MVNKEFQNYEVNVKLGMISLTFADRYNESSFVRKNALITLENV